MWRNCAQWPLHRIWAKWIAVLLRKIDQCLARTSFISFLSLSHEKSQRWYNGGHLHGEAIAQCWRAIATPKNVADEIAEDSWLVEAIGKEDSWVTLLSVLATAKSQACSSERSFRVGREGDPGK